MTSERRPPPKIRLRTPEGTARILRREFARHNLQVIFLAGATLVLAGSAWLLLYGVLCCALVLVITIVGTPPGHIVRDFGILFAVAALCATLHAWVDRLLTPDARPRDGKKPGEVLADVLLALPRLTLDIGGTLTAWLRLGRRELLEAAALLHWLGEERRIALSSLPQVITGTDAVPRILFALQVIQAVDMHRDETGLWLRFSALCPAALRPGKDDYADAN
jgi:hypothetical protein